MSVRSARPDVSDVTFQVFRSLLHPELFTVRAWRRLELEKFSATLRICESGHWIVFQTEAEALSELIVSKNHPLPEQRRFLQRRLRGSRDECIHFESGLTYQVSYQVEQLVPSVFLNLHDELLLDCRTATLWHRFPSPNRWAPQPLSLIRAEVWRGSLVVHTFHTFPENCAIVKTQSLFEVE